MNESECSSLGGQEKGDAVQSLVTNIRSVRAKEDKVLGCEEADGGPLSPKMDRLVCILPGSIGLGATGGLTLSNA
jgi:hypothetical protein